jgi:hypothetical protein
MKQIPLKYMPARSNVIPTKRFFEPSGFQSAEESLFNLMGLDRAAIQFSLPCPLDCHIFIAVDDREEINMLKFWFVLGCFTAGWNRSRCFRCSCAETTLARRSVERL